MFTSSVSAGKKFDWISLFKKKKFDWIINKAKCCLAKIDKKKYFFVLRNQNSRIDKKKLFIL